MIPLVLLFSYNRPTLIKETLKSISDSTCRDWRLVLIDDASDFPIEDIAKSVLSKEEWSRTTFIKIPDTKEEKLARKGSWTGLWANNLIRVMPSDFVVWVCDDDLLKPDYLEKLCKYYEENPEVMYSFAHVETFGEADGTSWLNKPFPVDPYCQVDASQVSWRSECFKEGGVRFPYPKTSCLDSELFGQLCRKYGLCPFNGLVGQKKRIHKNMLGKSESLDRID